ncbi:MAG: alpha-D-ribose 1-methylphosphonate 5-triphosphate diphosphatase [Rhodospirillaceae bacterium]|nr:alpha-D-ribose 1-methylphosphonate 5-triphosphate diphosphatase [Rhodospirillaceae bacterium]
MGLCIEGGRVLTADGALTPATVVVDDGIIAALPSGGAGRMAGGPRIDAGGRLVLPGIVDIHGDAFERQIMPRPNVHFPLDVALHDTDRQLVANGITTAYHGVTLSWEPGLRGRDRFVELRDAFRRLAPDLAADTRLHLRFETHNLDAADDVEACLAGGEVGLLAFNDHIADIVDELSAGGRAAEQYADRTGRSVADLLALARAAVGRAAEVPDTLRRLAGSARRHGVAMLSHDDTTPETRRFYHDLGCAIAEFPVTEAAAHAAHELGNPIVMGAPNVLRGGSHKRFITATDFIRAGLCTVLASDYYYPAQLHAAFKLAADGVLPLPAAWALVSTNAADAAGLADRGRLGPGQRADIVIVDDANPRLPRIMATIIAGRVRYAAGIPRD